jgi:hypothetical protein
MQKKLRIARTWVILWAGVAILALAGHGWAAIVDFQPFPLNFHPDGTPWHDPDVIMAAIANVPPDVGIVYDADGNTDDIQVWNKDRMGNWSQVYVGPLDISATLDRIRLGDHMALERNDGGFFNLGPDELPNIPRMGENYYMEFVVWFAMDLDAGNYNTSAHPFDPSVVFPGPMRILLGLGGEVYFTGDHYGQGPAQLPAYYVYVPPGC